jgi:tyrosine-protein kinase Etk/Wzc
LEQNPNIRPLSSPESIDWSKLLDTIRNNRIWILAIFISVNMMAYLFIRYTKNLYESESQLKLDIKQDATELGIKGIVDDQNMNVVSGEIEIIQSTLFLNRVLDYSNFEISFFSVGRVLNDELFNKAPAWILSYNKEHSLYNVPINFEEINTREFALQTPDGEETKGRYGQKIVLGDLEMVMERNDRFIKGDEIGYFFLINSREVLLDYLGGNLTAEPLSFSANTIRISFKDHNPQKAQSVLNKIDTLYLQYSNEQKNLANKQKIDWLTNELGHIEKRMEDYENYFKTFTLQNKTNDLEEDFRQTILSINTIDSQRYTYTRRVAELNRALDGVNKNEFQFPLLLRSMLPEMIREQMENVRQLQAEQDKLKLSYKEVTFAYRQKQKEIETIKKAVLDQLIDIKKDWLKKLEELNKTKSALEIEFAGLPDKNTEFTKNQRFYKLYEEFYLTLMQSKSEFEIAQAGSIPDFKILSPASLPAVPISPKKLMVAGIGGVASLVLIFLFVGILYLANNRITNLKELEKINHAPILGSVPLSRQTNGGLQIKDHPKSMVSEAIRTLRTNLDFFNITALQKVIAVSSTVSGEGKSFIAMNLGGVIALSNKKVVLIDLDMRKAKTDLPTEGTDTTKGVSTILIRRNTWQECVVRTSMENFDFIPSGPHPPNPSELLLNGEFSELIEALKKQYDFIIMDTPPVGLVTDGIMAMKRADVSVYVFRANYSKREFIGNLERIININKFSNITTLLNAVPASAKTYGYGYYEESSRPGKLKSIFKA